MSDENLIIRVIEQVSRMDLDMLEVSRREGGRTIDNDLHGMFLRLGAASHEALGWEEYEASGGKNKGFGSIF